MEKSIMVSGDEHKVHYILNSSLIRFSLQNLSQNAFLRLIYCLFSASFFFSQAKFLSYLITVFMVAMAVFFSSRMAGWAVCPGAGGITGGCVSGGEDVAKTCLAFALLTVAAQAHLASVLLMDEKKKRNPPAASWVAWLLAVSTCASVSGMFLAYISYGGFVAATSLEWPVAGVASAVNLAVAACTVLVSELVYTICSLVTCKCVVIR